MCIRDRADADHSGRALLREGTEIAQIDDGTLPLRQTGNGGAEIQLLHQCILHSLIPKHRFQR